MKEWKKPEYPEKTPDDELQKTLIKFRLLLLVVVLVLLLFLLLLLL